MQIHKTGICGINKQPENKGGGEGKKKNVVNSRIKICSLRSAAHSAFSLLTLCSSVEPFHTGLFSEICGQAWKCVEASLCLDGGGGKSTVLVATEEALQLGAGRVNSNKKEHSSVSES